jgi:hypothetical protein
MPTPLFAKGDFTLPGSWSRESLHEMTPLLPDRREPAAFPLKCPNCKTLTNEYERLNQACSKAEQAFATRGLTGSARDYVALNAAVEKARINSANALLELQRHWGLHRETLLMTFRAKSETGLSARPGNTQPVNTGNRRDYGKNEGETRIAGAMVRQEQ